MKELTLVVAVVLGILGSNQSSDGAKTWRGKGVDFKEVVIADGKTKAGLPFTSRTYESSDGVGVSWRWEKQESRLAAQEAFLEQTGRGTVVERSSAKDQPGKRGIQRAVVRSIHENKPYWLVVFIQETNLHLIGSASKSHVLEFEKKLLAGTI